ncbi:MAG: DMT family transporter [Acidimicrobiia bacterium]
MEQARSARESVEGTQPGGFRPFDWGHIALTSLIFGSAFLWISIALRSLSPGVIAFTRVVLGAGAIALFRSARILPAPSDWSRVVVAALVGQAGPSLLFAMAEERISSSLTGMLVSGIPVFAAVLAALLTRTRPSGGRVAGLTLGFTGIALLGLPALGESTASAVGVGMVISATIGYAVAAVFYAPLQQRYGANAVVLWTLSIAAVALAPFGIVGAGDSSLAVKPIAALVILGVVGTGFARSLMVAAFGRLGTVRASIISYLIPIVALVLGVVVLDETVEWIQIAGALVAIAGGWLLSRGRTGQAVQSST